MDNIKLGYKGGGELIKTSMCKEFKNLCYSDLDAMFLLHTQTYVDYDPSYGELKK